MVMLSALIAIYASTESLLGATTIMMTVGVRQGSPTSCLLFVVFVDDLIRIIRASCGMDGFLQCLDALVLMDDTILLATTKCNMERKIVLLQDYRQDYGMRVNQGKKISLLEAKKVIQRAGGEWIDGRTRMFTLVR